MSEAASTTIPGLFKNSTSEKLTTRDFAFGIQWIIDVNRCNLRLIDRVKASQEVLNDEIFKIKNRPDPPPPERLAAVVRAGQTYGGDLEELLAATSGSMELSRDVLSPPSAVSRASQSVTMALGEGQVFRTGLPPLSEHAFRPHSGTGEHHSPGVVGSSTSVQPDQDRYQK